MTLLQEALNELEFVPAGTEFIVKDLFKGYYWNNLPKSDRLTLGTLFLHSIQTNPNLSIKPVKKNAANQQIYIKN